MAYIPPVAYNGSKIISAASTNLTVLKAAPGVLGYLFAGSIAAGPVYVKLYNSVAATVGTTVPIHTFVVPGNTGGAGSNLVPGGLGINLTVGISVAITGGIADTDTTIVSANQIVLNCGTI